MLLQRAVMRWAARSLPEKKATASDCAPGAAWLRQTRKLSGDWAARILGSSMFGSSTLGAQPFWQINLRELNLRKINAREIFLKPALFPGSSTGAGGVFVRSIVNKYVSSLWWLSGSPRRASGGYRRQESPQHEPVQNPPRRDSLRERDRIRVQRQQSCTLCATGFIKYASVSPILVTDTVNQ